MSDQMTPQQQVAEMMEASFLCPISQNIMIDPVTADDHHTYERPLITQWQASHGTSPLTRQRISSNFRPNRALKSAIEAFLFARETLLQSSSHDNDDDDHEGLQQSVQGQVPMGMRMVDMSVEDKVPSNLRTIRSRAVVAVEPLHHLLKDISWQPPQIVVVGAESHGKSTMMERLLGLPVFPRAKKLCTRVPIRVQLRRGEDTLPVIGTVRINAETGKRESQELEEKMTVSSANMLEEVQSFMQRILERQEAQKADSGVSLTREIVVQLQHPSHPELDLVDLPGLVAQAAQGEDENMPEKTFELTKRYMKLHKHHSMFLVVHNSCQEMRQSSVLKLVKDLDVVDQSLGVLTWCDRYFKVQDLDDEEDAVPLRQLLNETNAGYLDLGYGWVCTATNSKKNQSLGDAALLERFSKMEQLEKKEFEERGHGVMWGIGELVKKVVKSYDVFLVKSWIPQAIKVIDQQLSQQKERIAPLGLPFHIGQRQEEMEKLIDLLEIEGSVSVEQMKRQLQTKTTELFNRGNGVSIADECEKWWINALEPLRHACAELQTISLNSNQEAMSKVKMNQLETQQKRAVTCLQSLKRQLSGSASSDIASSCLKKIHEDSSQFRIQRFRKWIEHIENEIKSVIGRWLRTCVNVVDAAIKIGSDDDDDDDDDGDIVKMDDVFKIHHQDESKKEVKRLMKMMLLGSSQWQICTSLSLTCLKSLDSSVGQWHIPPCRDHHLEDMNENQRMDILISMKRLGEAKIILKEYADELGVDVEEQDDVSRVLNDEEFEEMLQSKVGDNERLKTNIRSIRNNSCGNVLE